jgi:hypothetical protein
MAPDAGFAASLASGVHKYLQFSDLHKQLGLGHARRKGLGIFNDVHFFMEGRFLSLSNTSSRLAGTAGSEIRPTGPPSLRLVGRCGTVR